MLEFNPAMSSPRCFPALTSLSVGRHLGLESKAKFLALKLMACIEGILPLRALGLLGAPGYTGWFSCCSINALFSLERTSPSLPCSGTKKQESYQRCRYINLPLHPEASSATRECSGFCWQLCMPQGKAKLVFS